MFEFTFDITGLGDDDTSFFTEFNKAHFTPEVKAIIEDEGVEDDYDVVKFGKKISDQRVTLFVPSYITDLMELVREQAKPSDVEYFDQMTPMRIKKATVDVPSTPTAGGIVSERELSKAEHFDQMTSVKMKEATATAPSNPTVGGKAKQEWKKELKRREMKRSSGRGLTDSELLQYLQERPLPQEQLGKLAQQLSRYDLKLLNLAHDWLHVYLPHVLRKIDRVTFGIMSEEDLKQSRRSNPLMPRSRRARTARFPLAHPTYPASTRSRPARRPFS